MAEQPAGLVHDAQFVPQLRPEFERMLPEHFGPPGSETKRWRRSDRSP